MHDGLESTGLTPNEDHSHAPRGNASTDAPRSALGTQSIESRHRTPEITMSKFFDELMESVQQMNEILRGEREPTRELHVDALQVKKIRKTHHRLIPERGNDQKT
jgi:hypothetical protein